MDIQRNLETNVEKRTKDTYGPPMGKRLVVFMDDMNMPRVSCQQFQGGVEMFGVALVALFTQIQLISPVHDWILA